MIDRVGGARALGPRSDGTIDAMPETLDAAEAPADAVLQWLRADPPLPAGAVLISPAVDLRAQLLGRDGTGAGLTATAEHLRALSAIAQDAMLAARPEYILASLGAIEARHGSVARYLLDELALEATALERLRERILN